MAPRDEFTDASDVAGTFRLQVVGGSAYVFHLESDGWTQLEVPRHTFNRLVDWYIDTPAIRAALKAKDEEIARLKARGKCTCWGLASGFHFPDCPTVIR